MQTRSTYRSHGKGAGRTYPIPELNSVTQSTANTEPDLLPDADVTEGLLSEPLKRFSLPSVPDDTAPSPSPLINVKNFKYLGSYNWLDAPKPTILVPGSPGIWRNRAVPFRVPFDEGLQIFDPNGYHMGSSSASPLIPLFRAVDVVAEDNADTSMDWPSIDIVADRSSLRKLLRWIKHSDSQRENSAKLQKFRIDLQLGGAKTVLMQRWDTHTCQYATPPISGCRVNFEKTTITPAPGCESGSGHFRIVQYELDGVWMVVRFEVDAYAAQPDTNQNTNHSGSADHLSEALAGLSLAFQTLAPIRVLASESTSLDNHDAIVAVARGGTQVPQSSIIEISTRSMKGAQRHNWEETYTQLFLSQTPLHYLAVHERGLFQAITTRPLNSPEFQRIAARDGVQRNFKQLVHLLREIQALVAEHGRRGRLSLVCRGGQLEVFERSDGNDVGCLSDSELARFGI